MSVRIVSVGLNQLVRDMAGFMDDLNDEIAATLTNNASEVEIYARQNHGYKTRSSNLEKSTKGEYSYPSINTHHVEFKLDPSLTTVANGKSYGVFMHEGTYQGYSQSPIAPKYSHSVSKSGKGWKADPFLWEAIKAKWNPEKAIEKATDKIRRKYNRI